MKQEKHGMRGTRTYKTWSEMRQRCNNSNNDKYKYYGNRGITVCQEWDKSFLAFFNDMGERPEKMTIDRIDNSKGYYKENCKWATQKEQNRNTRANRIITYNGESRCMSEWAEIYGISDKTLWRRLSKGMKPPECFLPVGAIPRGSNSHKATLSASYRRGNI